jgi:hypothetical protein
LVERKLPKLEVAGSTPVRRFLVVLSALVLAMSTATARAGADAAPPASASALPSGYELHGLAAGPSGDAFVVAFHPIERGSETAEATYVFEVSSSGEVSRLPVQLHDSVAGLSGIVATPDNSVWVPTENGVDRIGASGIEAEVPVGGVENTDMATDHKGGVWVASGSRVFHVDAGGAVAELPLSSLDRSRYATITRLVDRGGTLWMAVARGQEELTREVIEHVPGRRLRFLPVRARFRYPDKIAVSDGVPILQSGLHFIEGVGAGGALEEVPAPDHLCFLTEQAATWCQVRKTVYRAVPRGDRSPTVLPEGGLRIRRLATSGSGQVWFAAERGAPCRGGGLTCSSIPAGTITVGWFPSPQPR